MLLECLELGDDDVRVGRLVLGDMLAARLEKLREDDRATDRANVRDVRVHAAVGPFLVATCLMDFGKVAVVSVLVAEGATRAWWVELLKAVVVEYPHLVHPAHVCLN